MRLPLQILFLTWVSSIEHYWVILAERRGRAVEGLSETDELVLDKRVERIEQQRADSSGACGGTLMGTLRNSWLPTAAGALHCVVIPPIPMRVAGAGGTPQRRFVDKRSYQGQEEAFGFPGTGACCDYHISSRPHRLLKDAVLVLIRLKVGSESPTRNEVTQLICRLRAP